MRPFKWNTAHAVYLPEIDAEHRAIYQAAAEMQQAVDGGAPQGRVLAIFHGLVAAAEDHFAHEERLMVDTNYRSRDWHCSQHETARKRARQCGSGMAAGDEDAAPEFLEFLASWMRDHMSVADRIMGAHLRNYGRAHRRFAKAS